MHNGEVLLKKVDDSVAHHAHTEEWIKNGRIIVACGNLIRTRMIVSFLRHRSGNLYVQLSKLENPSAAIMDLEHNVYLEVKTSASLNGLSQANIRAGIHDIHGIIRMCRSQNLQDDPQKLWTTRKKILRAIADLHSWILEGVYEARVKDHRVDAQKIVNTDSQPIDAQKIQNFVADWVKRARRTKPIDKENLALAINSLYERIGLQPPRIVYASNPLIMVIAATFATALSYLKENPTAESIPFQSGDQTLLGHELYDMTVKKLYFLRDDLADEQTLHALEEALNRTEGTPTGYGGNGTGGDAVQCAISDAIRAIKTDNGGLLAEQDFAFENMLAREIFKCTASAINLSDDHWSTNIASGAADTSLFDQLTQTLGGGSSKSSNMLLNSILDCRHLIRACNTQEFEEFRSNAYAEVLGAAVPNKDLHDALQNVWKKCGPIVMHKEFCVVSEFPTQYNIDHDGILHGEGHPSQTWKDGWKLYHWHGMRVTKQFAEAPETITVEDIESESNLEMRRLMLERYGIKKFLVDVGAKEVQRDECGILYRHTIHEALEAIVMVEVTNSTSEADGTYKKYFLRVPPHVTTARAGIAWTFNLEQDQYSPMVQT